MLNYLKSEFYRSFRQRAYYIFLLLCFALIVLVAVIANTEIMERTLDNFLDVMRVIVIIGSVIFPAFFVSLNRKETGIHVQMNSFGLRRGTIFFGDFLMIALNMLIFALMLLAFAIGIGLLVFGRLPYSGSAIPDFMVFVGRVYLLLLPLLALAQAFGYLFSNNGLAISLYFMLAFILPGILMNFVNYKAIDIICKLMPTNYLMTDLGVSDPRWFTICIVFNLVLWLLLAGVTYKKKEI